MSGRALVWAFRVVPRLPFSFVTWLGRRGADLMCLLNASSVRRMRANHERVLGRKIRDASFEMPCARISMLMLSS